MSALSSSGITGIGTGVMVIERTEGVPPAPEVSVVLVGMPWTKFTEPISGSGLGKSSRVWPPRLSLRLRAPWATQRDTVSIDGRSVARFQPGLYWCPPLADTL